MSQDASFAVRYNLSLVGLQLFAENPLLGVGTGQFGAFWVDAYQALELPALGEIARYMGGNPGGVVPRSFAVLIASEGGLISLLLLASFLYKAIRPRRLLEMRDLSDYLLVGYVVFTLLNQYSPHRPLLWVAIAYLGERVRQQYDSRIRPHIETEKAA